MTKNWEAVGIDPDIKVLAVDALRVALIRAKSLLTTK